MDQWIPYEEGEYAVEDAFLRTPSGHGVRAVKTVVEVYVDSDGRRQLKGFGQLVNALLMDLMDQDDQVDLVLDFAPAHRYRLIAPTIRAGKLFTPGVRAAFHFYPRSPWVPLSDTRFEAMVQETIFLQE
mgnify:CR=1 FL=1